jgi:hypothetical protein
MGVENLSPEPKMISPPNPHPTGIFSNAHARLTFSPEA